MTRLLLTTEGPTEQIFASQVLRPHLAPQGIYLTKPRCTAIGQSRGIVHRGGLLKYAPMREDIMRWIRQDSDPEARFSTMIDLYALPKDFPGYDAAKHIADAYDRVAFLEDHFAADIASQRFIPYIQLHEFEALLLADLRKIRDYYDPSRVVDLVPIERALNLEPNPELIDDGRESAPSKRITGCIPEYSFAKPTAGPIIAQSIGIEKLRNSCRHFGTWLQRLESLGC